MICEVINSNSKGNAVIYHEQIMVDCGVPFAALKDYIPNIKLILLTHKHGDHFKLKTLQKMVRINPNIRIACGDWMKKELKDLDHDKIDYLDTNKLYDYGMVKVSPFTLYHDVPNCGWRIIKGNHKIIHATDTYTMQGISAVGYDVYAIEHNYDEEIIQEEIEKAKAEKRYTRAFNSMDSHLSIQQAQEFIERNRRQDCQIVELHKSSRFGYGYD